MAAKDDIKTEIDRLFPYVEDASVLVVSCLRRDYSASRLCRAVEDCDAHVLNLNVVDAAMPFGDGASCPVADYEDEPRTYVELRVSHRNAGAVARSVERYGYAVEYVRNGCDTDADGRFENLMCLLNV